MNRLTDAEVLGGLRELPALPALVLELIQSFDREGASSEELSLMIASDQALAAKTLRLANSSFYGMPGQITSISDATTVLGVRTLRNVASAALLTGHFASACSALDFQAFWRHALGTALCSAAVARATKVDEGMAFTLGLLHDIGRLALASAFAPAFADVLAYEQAHDCPSLEAERAVLGIDHAGVGALITRHWNFSDFLVVAVAAHHEPPPRDGQGASWCDLLHVSDNIAHALDLSNLDGDAVPLLSMPAWLRVGLAPSACRDVFKQVHAQHGAMCSALLG